MARPRIGPNPRIVPLPAQALAAEKGLCVVRHGVAPPLLQVYVMGGRRAGADCPRRTLSSWEMKSFLIVLTLAGAALAQPARWTEKTANEWYAKQPWLVGSNYLPATAINQLEMWQADTFDPDWINTELGWAEDLGMNTMRVFLHDLPDRKSTRLNSSH